MNGKEEREATVKNRALGCLWGLVVGDALGAPFEFQSPHEIDVPKQGKYTTGGHWDVSYGEWTDDSAMAMALADSLNEVGWDRDDQMQRYLDWYYEGEYQGRGESYGVGGQTRRALYRYEETGDVGTSGEPHYRNSGGNGSIMRLAPVAVWCAVNHDDPDEAIEAAYKFGRSSSTPTHGHRDCVDGAGILSALLCSLILEDTERKDRILLPGLFPFERISEYIMHHRAYDDLFLKTPSNWTVTPPVLNHSGGGVTGYVLDTFHAAAHSFKRSLISASPCPTNDRFAMCIRAAVSLGGDTDTVGAVAGQIAGAMWGVTAIHPGWLVDLDKRKIKQAEEIFSALVKNGKVFANV